MFKKYQFKKYDIVLVLIILIFAFISVTAIGSATLINLPTGTSHFAKRQLLGYVSGVILMIIASLIDYKFIAKFSPIIYILNIGLLVAVLLFGDETKGGLRWIEISDFKIQPSEFSKLFMLIVMAKYFDFFKEKINKIYVILGGLILIGIPFVLINIQPDLTTSIVVLAIFVILIYMAKISYKYIFALIIITLPLMVFAYFYIQSPNQKLLKPHQKTRIMAMFKPDEYKMSGRWQTDNSIQAIGSGQLRGKGLYQGKLHQYKYLPEPQTDFIYSIIGEEFGFIGCSFVLFLYLLMMFKIIFIAKDSQDLLGQLLASGFIGLLMIQVFINVGVTLGIVPNTGLPLPFVSYGISSLWTNLAMVGIILNVGMQRK